MPLLYMVRHGEASASWDKDTNPGLSALGQAQAQAVADELRAKVGGKLPLLTSPMLRCQETALPLASLWQSNVHVEPRVIEVPSPITDLKERHVWLRTIMKGSWAEADKTSAALKPWREGIVAAMKDAQHDTVIFTHFIAINAAASYATHDSRVVSFLPDNCSVTVFETTGIGIRLLERGRELVTTVN